MTNQLITIKFFLRTSLGSLKILTAMGLSVTRCRNRWTVALTPLPRMTSPPPWWNDFKSPTLQIMYEEAAAAALLERTVAPAPLTDGDLEK